MLQDIRKRYRYVNQEVEIVAEAMVGVFSRVDVLKEILSDQGTNFISFVILNSHKHTLGYLPHINVRNSRASVLKNKIQTLLRLRLHLKCLPLSVIFRRATRTFYFF